ncbi:MAG: T9SS type A sorting domain-containing protein [Proteiniphilum sp.]
MKRCLSLFLMISLASGAGASLFAQKNTGDFDMKQQQDTTVIQHEEELRNTTRSQTQNYHKLQNKEKPQDSTKIKLTGNLLIIEDLPEDGVLEIYNIMGAKVYNRRIKAGTNQYVLSLPKGYYIIKIGKLTRKIAVK